MAHRRLGKSGLTVSSIGFGAFKIGRNQGVKYPAGYELPSDREAETLLNAVLDAGVNYIDTAPAYGLSEERIGRFLSKRRSEFVLSTKVGESFEQGRSRYDFSAAAVQGSVERSLRRLRTERLDLVFIHAHAQDVQILQETDAVAGLHALKERGLIASLGFSGKTVEGARLACAWADVLMVEYHLNDRSHEEAIAAAHAEDVGIVVKKPLASGTLPPRAALRFVLSNPGVASVVVGGLNLEHLHENLRIAAELEQ